MGILPEEGKAKPWCPTRAPKWLGIAFGTFALLAVSSCVFTGQEVREQSTPALRETPTAQAAGMVTEATPTSVDRLAPTATHSPRPTNTTIPSPTPTHTPAPSSTPAPTNTRAPSVAPTVTLTALPTSTPWPRIGKYRLLDDKSSETADTVIVDWTVLSEPNATAESLTSLLNDLYGIALGQVEAEETRSVEIRLRAYATESHWRAGQGAWAGAMYKDAGQEQPRLLIDEELLEAIRQPPQERFGLTESERKQVWLDINRAEDRAIEEAQSKYPEMAPADEYSSHKEELLWQYWGEVADKERLSLDELFEIVDEAVLKGWPLASLREEGASRVCDRRPQVNAEGVPTTESETHEG